jgi:hypothetical protein
MQAEEEDVKAADAGGHVSKVHACSGGYSEVWMRKA